MFNHYTLLIPMIYRIYMHLPHYIPILIDASLLYPAEDRSTIVDGQDDAVSSTLPIPPLFECRNHKFTILDDYHLVN